MGLITFSLVYSTLVAVALGRSASEDFQCFKCEEDTEKPRTLSCNEIQTCSGGRPVCAKLEFSAFFHGVQGTRTLKFCYDLSREQSSLPLEAIDLCDVAHHDFHSFTLETRSILGTVCKNKHSTWHMSHSCTSSLCNGALGRFSRSSRQLVFILAAPFVVLSFLFNLS